MTTEKVERRLAAILAADMVGFSRLMERDEEGTIARQKRHRADLIDPTIANHRGRIVKTTGDGMLVEFVSVVDAVRCAVEIQESMRTREANSPQATRIQYRIGINLGDIVIEGDDIFGDGVNIAARLEGLSEPGGVFISGTVHEHVAGKLKFMFEDAGSHEVKNIVRPIRVWRWVPDRTASAATTAASSDQLPLPDKASIAVLPFDNMSGDPEQEYFADGITEDIITALSRLRQFFVVSRNSTFTYKGRAVAVKEVSQELGSRYVIEGSVRKAGNRVRISAQLIDAESDRHLWAEHYDRDLDDLFALQDEITLRIIGAIAPELDEAEQERALRKHPDSLDALDLLYRALWHTTKMTKEGFLEAERLLKQSIAMDENFAPAWGALAQVSYGAVALAYSDSPKAAIEEAIECGRQAVSLDDKDATNHFSLGRAYTGSGNLDAAIIHFERALKINPSFALAHHGYAAALNGLGRFEEALRHSEASIRLSSRDPSAWTQHTMKAHALYFLGRYDEAIAAARDSIATRNAEFWSWTVLAAALTATGRDAEAGQAVKDALERNPKVSIGLIRGWPAWQNQAVVDVYLTDLRKAGLPE